MCALSEHRDQFEEKRLEREGTGEREMTIAGGGYYLFGAKSQ